MMRNVMKLILSFMLLFTFSAGELFSQETESQEAEMAPLNISAASSIEIDGTSTLHDWTVDAEEFSVNFKVPQSWTKGLDFWNPEEVEELTVNVPVEFLVSGKSGMDKRMYKALESDDHPEIIFEHTDMHIDDAEIEQIRGAKTLNIDGNLTVAGETRPVTLNVLGEILETNALKFSGQYTLNMTDFDVDPPSALLGTIKSGDEITIRFDIIFQ
jgi:polyisoprenoid-binding protein YceI